MFPQADRLLRTSLWKDGRIRMLKWAIIFFLISVVAGYFGFTGVASGARTIAKVLFFLALLVFVIVVVFGVILGKLIF